MERTPWAETQVAPQPAARNAPRARSMDRAADFVVRHLVGLMVLGLLVVTLLPFAAPLFMHWGWERPAALLYWAYGYTCHQLPQRSWFLFGPRLTYTVDEIQAVWPAPASQLRGFVGTPQMGWKVAWSDRMLSWYTMTALWFALYWLLRRLGVRSRPLRWSLLALALAPIALDGATHMLSDVMAGVSGGGFRDTNEWLRVLTANVWPAFYGGDHQGTFNWWSRLFTGLLGAWAITAAFYPRLELMLAADARRTHDATADFPN